ncbi:hypothetical protein GGI02_005524, partial [Coemansia sp. RSA 2322]
MVPDSVAPANPVPAPVSPHTVPVEVAMVAESVEVVTEPEPTDNGLFTSQPEVDSGTSLAPPSAATPEHDDSHADESMDVDDPAA